MLISFSFDLQIDLDTIEVSNLNRQFLFRQFHVGQSKAKVSDKYIWTSLWWLFVWMLPSSNCVQIFTQVARDAVLKFRPQISITPYHANVKDPDFNVDFFKQFSVVLNGLDNLDARRHVNRLCLAADVPLVESGTTGFLGQVTSIVIWMVDHLSTLYLFLCTLPVIFKLDIHTTLISFVVPNLLSFLVQHIMFYRI